MDEHRRVENITAVDWDGRDLLGELDQAHVEIARLTQLVKEEALLRYASRPRGNQVGAWRRRG